jgi:hypothetical protein
MPDAVKISELPALSSVNPNDIVPVVDEALTQTSRVTAGQIAAIGGGPPGNNTVSTAKLQDGAVTAVKVGFAATDRIIARTATGAGNGVEITCTAFARSLLDDADAAAARATLGAIQSVNNPTFTGTVTISGTAVVTGSVQNALGSQTAPSYTFTGDTNTGLFSPAADNVALTTNGSERLRFDSAGVLSTSLGTSGLYAASVIRAWARIDTTQSPYSVVGRGVSSMTWGADAATATWAVALFPALPSSDGTAQYAVICASGGEGPNASINYKPWSYSYSETPTGFTHCAQTPYTNAFNVGVLQDYACFIVVQ